MKKVLQIDNNEDKLKIINATDMEWEVGVSRYKLLYVRQINIKVLLSSIENYM